MPYYQQQSRLTGFGFRPNFGNYTAAYRQPAYASFNFSRPIYGSPFGGGAGYYRARSAYRPDPYGTSYGPAAVYGGGQPRQQQNCPRPLPATTSFDLDTSSAASGACCPCPQVQICQ